MAQCSKKTSSGKRCKASAVSGKKTCVFHTPKRGSSKSRSKSTTKGRGGRRFRA